MYRGNGIGMLLEFQILPFEILKLTEKEKKMFFKQKVALKRLFVMFYESKLEIL